MKPDRGNQPTSRIPTSMNIATLSVKVINRHKNLLNNTLCDGEGKPFVRLLQTKVHQTRAQDIHDEADVASCGTFRKEGGQHNRAV